MAADSPSSDTLRKLLSSESLANISVLSRNSRPSIRVPRARAKSRGSMMSSSARVKLKYSTSPTATTPIRLPLNLSSTDGLMVHTRSGSEGSSSSSGLSVAVLPISRYLANSKLACAGVTSARARIAPLTRCAVGLEFKVIEMLSPGRFAGLID